MSVSHIIINNQADCSYYTLAGDTLTALAFKGIGLFFGISGISLILIRLLSSPNSFKGLNSIVQLSSSELMCSVSSLNLTILAFLEATEGLMESLFFKAL